MITNDNHPIAGGMPAMPHADGQAALLLVESLIHGLCEKAVLTAHEAADIVDRAIDVARDAVETGPTDDGDATQRSQRLLSAIARSLRIDGDADVRATEG